ncbi:elongation factor-like GTPase 1 [Copidosoma floridanum]|uniref:elongation factor-like GTPase 1 n=1 Tax=Copidosoma floridanum TaxID=29053 RepID=UPI000C6FC618|nr:elongation factor-like GTPase 1 [Copidosoma floridanum]XP_023246499.1 elongation factor-like GTPase 1 [Copidosoma floridanum]
MRFLDLQKFKELQSKVDSIRNICILAHVDHGKTTLADSLVASNGIISNKLAGKLRYLDSRPDEQLRGITMKSSLITLHHAYNDSEFIVNLIDSPGHVDFASEVSTAVRLCDGAIIVVDVVEGVCPQTRTALCMLYAEGLKPVLVLNKIDRLISEIKLSPFDAYVHLNQVLEQVNAVMGEVFATNVMEKDEGEENVKSNSIDDLAKRDLADWQSALEEIDDSHLYFSPEQGNVLFASAIDGWGFAVKDFAKIFSEKLGFSEKVLLKTLWGDYYLNTKNKRIMKGAQKKAKKPLFVQLILENLWSLYDTVMVRKDKDMVASMVEKLNIKLTIRDLRHTDPKAQMRAICTQWLPLAKTCLDMICEKVPPPHKLPSEKVERLISGIDEFSSMPEETQQLKDAFLSCKSNENAPIIIFISKMFPVDKKSLPENKPKPLTAEELLQRREIARQRHAEKLEKDKFDKADVISLTEADLSNKAEKEKQTENEEESCEDCLVAFARVYSGTVSIGSEVYVLGPKHNPRTALERQRNGELIDNTLQLKDLKAGRYITKVTISKLYLLMGRELEPIDKVPAGNVIGIGNLEDHVLKTATLSSTIACPSFSELTSLAVPILRVALEPKHPNDLQKLINGLKLLNQADACALVHIQETGEVVLNTAGEVHLERCIEDLKLRYAKVDINVSEPIVSFRETIVPPPKVDMVNEVIEKKSDDTKLETRELTWGNGRCYFEIDAKPLPDVVTKTLEKNTELIKELDKRLNNLGKEKESMESLDIAKLSLDSPALLGKMHKNVETFKTKLLTAFKESGWNDDILNKIWCFGPRKCGPNIFVNESTFVRKPFWEQQLKSMDPRDSFYNSLINGFQLATLSGPLCDEPMTGVCFVLKKWEIVEDTQSESGTMSQNQRGGQLMSAFNQACKNVFNSRRPRIVTPMYHCSVLVNSDVLGKMYAVFGRRQGRVISAESAGFGGQFRVLATLPVPESFHLASELRTQTSGLASPQLVFSHWEVIEQDPFWVPSTEEEYLHFGEKADSGNRAKRYIDAVRRRKGLPVDSQLVTHAEKQRTLSKKK